MCHAFASSTGLPSLSRGSSIIYFSFNSLWLLFFQTMANMNKALKLPQIQKIMMEFEKQV